MDYSNYSNSHYSRSQSHQQYPQYPPGYQDPYAQQQQQHQHQQSQHQSHFPQQQHYQPPPHSHQQPHIRNPFAGPPPPARGLYAGQNAAFDPEHEAQVAQWQAAYASHDATAGTTARGGKGERGDHTGGDGISSSITNSIAAGPHLNASTNDHAAATAAPADSSAAASSADKKRTVVRKGGGQTWEDSTLLEWDPTQFRIMVGNLAGEVTDDSLAKAFAAYGVAKARVVRDKRTTKSRGYGFVAFTDGEMGFRAAREMVGKYIGSHPVTIQRSKTDIRPVVQKDRLAKGKNAHRATGRDDKKGSAKQNDPLRAHTGAHIERKPVRNANGMKMLG